MPIHARTDRLPALVAGLALLLLGSGPAPAAEPPPVVVRVCSACHGLAGEAPWAQIPRLAAQNAAYLQQQMQAYRLARRPPVAEIPPEVTWPAWLADLPPRNDGARDDPDALRFMVGIAQDVDPAASAAAVAWYAVQPPAPGQPGDPALVAQGRSIYTAGLAAKGVPPCEACHGDQAQGLGPFPRLAGQHAPYLQRQVLAFQDGRRAHGSAMTTVAKGLDPAEALAVATYIQSL